MGICRSHVSLSRGRLWLLPMLYMRFVQEPFRKVSGKRVRKVSGMSGFKLDILDMAKRDPACPIMSGHVREHVRLCPVNVQ